MNTRNQEPVRQQFHAMHSALHFYLCKVECVCRINTRIAEQHSIFAARRERRELRGASCEARVARRELRGASCDEARGARRELRGASCEARVARRELRGASCEARVARRELRGASCEARVARRELRGASCEARVARRCEALRGASCEALRGAINKLAVLEKKYYFRSVTQKYHRIGNARNSGVRNSSRTQGTRNFVRNSDISN